MKKYCCETLEQNLTNNCSQHGLKCSDNIVQRFKKDFGIPHPDGFSYIKIEYCPWCGKKLKN